LLIIFDLDDTLIDTSGSIIPFKMKICLEKLISEGLKIPSFEEGYEKLLSFNAASMKSKDALFDLVSFYGGDVSLVDRVIGEMTTPLPKDFFVKATPNAKEILDLFSKKHILTLVTSGYPPFQMEKLEKAGIDRSYFSKIAIPEDFVKKPLYASLLEEFSLSPEEAIVCGDRVALDLAPAFELGIRTVHMKWGRGIVGKTEPWISHAISDLSELRRIVEV
jgi:FMN phosphatase YigB (HAD superfamily)